MKKLIIVCDEKRREFADYLSQLISMEDDADNNTIGVKDGTVAAQVWGEKEYKANSATISSNQHILFIGNSKLIKDKRSHMKSMYSDFGINYGWLGKQGAIAVEKTVSLDKYEDFITFGKKYEENIEKLVDKKTAKIEKAAAGAGVAGAAFGGKAIAAIVAPIAPIALAPIVGIGAAIPLVKKIKLDAKIKKQMYSCAVMKFYLEDLNKFLGLEQAE